MTALEDTGLALKLAEVQDILVSVEQMPVARMSLVYALAAKLLIEQPGFARALFRVREAGREPIVREALEFVLIAAQSEFAERVDWEKLALGQASADNKKVRQLPSPPELFGAVVMGVAAVRIAGSTFTRPEVQMLTLLWNDFAEGAKVSEPKKLRLTAGDAVGRVLFWVIGVPLLVVFVLGFLAIALR
jgi:hypothetical protein